MPRGEGLQIGPPGHGAVVLHDLAEHASGRQAGQPRQVHRSFGLSTADEHAAFARDERKDVPRSHEIPGRRRGRHCRADGRRPVCGADAGGHAPGRLDRDGERRLKGRFVVADHQGQVELARLVRRQRQADEPPAVGGHEVDGFRRRFFSGQDEIALVLAVLVVGEDDHPPRAKVVQGALDAIDALATAGGAVCVCLLTQCCFLAGASPRDMAPWRSLGPR